MPVVVTLKVEFIGVYDSFDSFARNYHADVLIQYQHTYQL